MNGQCGGCRARAYGMTGDLMAEDPLCTHTPGKFAGSPLLVPSSAPLATAGSAGGAGGPPRSSTAPNRRRRSRGTMRPPRA